MLSLLTSLATPAAAADHAPVFIPELQYRPRFETDSGRDRLPGEGGVAYVTHRARLGASLRWGPVQTRIVFQDVRAWGEELDTRRDFSGDGIDLAIGTLTWTPSDRWALTLGREEVSLLDERLVARAGWRQPGRHFDGGRVTYADGRWAAEVAGYLVIDGDDFQFATQDQVEPGRGDQTLWWARGGLETQDSVAQLLATVDDRRQVENEEVFRVTPGVFVKHRQGPIRTRFELYGQFGSVLGGDVAVRAGLLGAQVAFAPDWTASPSLTLSYDGMTGEGNGGDGVFTSFDTLRGANHRYYGNLDYAMYFRGGPATGEGLHDPHIGLGLRPTEAWSIQLDQHLMAPAVARDEAWVALEPDLNVSFAPLDVLTITGGGAVWVEVHEPREPAEWFAYLMVDLNLRGPEIGG